MNEVAESKTIFAPYVTRWSQEQNLPTALVERGFVIGYADELPHDRDERGVLWRRAALRRGMGQPDFAAVHPMRQRRAMRRLLCQVCGGPADRTTDGVLWLLLDLRAELPSWPEGMGVTEPPICRLCPKVTMQRCPAFRRGAVAAVRVAECPIVGVRGELYRPNENGTSTVEAANVFYDEKPETARVVASALIRELRGCVFVSLEELLD